MYNKAVFLDKDGTLINDIPYNVDPELITVSAGSLQGLRLLNKFGYMLVVISNQAGVAKGYFSEDELVPVENKLIELLQAGDIKLSGFYYCPHHIEGVVKKYAVDCNCRKPGPGLLLKAAAELSVNLTASWMIGDILNDVEAGKRAGCRAILIDNGNETEWLMDNGYRLPDKKVANIDHAAAFIISMDKNGK